MKSEAVWRSLRSLGDAARPRPRSNGKGSLRERKNDEMRELIFPISAKKTKHSMKYKNCEGIKNRRQDRCLWGVKCKRITIGKDPRNRCHGAMHCLPTQMRACKKQGFKPRFGSNPRRRSTC